LGLRDLIKGQLLDVIEYQTDDKRILAHRFENGGKQIMIGAQLTVRPGQIAVFINEGEIADVYTEGQYELTTSNMPVLTKLKSWKYGLVGTDSQFTVEECRPHITGKIVSSFTDYFSESKVTYFDAYSNMDEFSEGVAGKIGETFSGFGLSLSDFVVKELRAPENVEKAMDDRAAVGAMGGMGMYQAKVMTDATADAAVTMAGNEGGGMGPMGMQMGAGVAMGGMMGNMMGNNMQPGQTAQSTQEAKPIVQCPKCNGSVAGGTKFCPHCGNNMAPAVSGVSCVKCGMTLLAGAKFCPECGTKQSAVCSQCGVELTPGTKFCPDCGNKQ
jgi:membrane protease subunit (stomatin/prohibitin family)